MSPVSLTIIFAIQLIIITLLTYWLYKNTLKKNFYEKKYSKIIDIDSEIEKSTQLKNSINSDIEALRSNYKRSEQDQVLKLESNFKT